MKRFLIALAVTSLAVFGSANAASIPNLFKFADVDGTTPSFTAEVSLVDNATGYNSVIFQLFDGTGPSLALGVESNSLAFGTLEFPVQVISGAVEWTKGTNTVEFLQNDPDASLYTITGTGSLTENLFSFGLSSAGVDFVPIITVLNGVNRYRFTFSLNPDTTISFTVSDIVVVPIPAAALLFLSGIGGLLLVARRNRARSRQEERAGEPLPA